MAKLAVPPLDPKLRELLSPVLAKKSLDDDALWSHEILPLLHKHLESLDRSVRLSATTNANAPAARITDEINKTLGEISRNLTRSFARAAPFTVHRVAELLLAYQESGYSLTTVVSAQKWLSALARALSVSSSESMYNRKRSAVPSSTEPPTRASEQHSEVSDEERSLHKLPGNIRFVRLRWPDKSSGKPENGRDSFEEPAPKRAKHDPEQNASDSSETGSAHLLKEEQGTGETSHKILSKSPVETKDENGERNSGNENNELGPSSPEVGQDTTEETQIAEEENHGDSHDRPPQLLRSLIVNGQKDDSETSRASTSAFYENGSIDHDEQKGRKEEVSI